MRRKVTGSEDNICVPQAWETRAEEGAGEAGQGSRQNETASSCPAAAECLGSLFLQLTVLSGS